MNELTTATDLGETTAERVAELTAPLGDAADTAIRTARENVGLTVLGGLAIGVAVGAMLPFGRRRKTPKKAARALAATLAATVTELSQTLAAQARDKAQATTADAGDKLGSAGETIGKTLHDQSESLGKQTRKLADEAAEQLNESGKAIARQLIKLVEKARR